MENYPFGTRYILVSNHMSYMDAIILIGVLPEYCNFVAKKELANNLFLRPALKKFDVFLVDRFDTKKVTEDTRSIYRGVRRGRRPVFFAEGTLQRMPGLLPFQMGAFILAGEEMLPIVPLVIRGTRNILREGSWFPRRGRVQIDIGPLCYPESSDWSGAIELRDSVRRSMLSRLGEPDLAGEYTSLLQLGFKRSEKDEDPETQH
jgi:1-acyl-sn-glycerol-3-phosphate acyltransferase